MKKLLLAATVGTVLLGAATVSRAGVHFDIGIGIPLPPAPVVVSRPCPPVVVAPPVCRPAPQYYPAPVVYCPPRCKLHHHHNYYHGHDSRYYGRSGYGYGGRYDNHSQYGGYQHGGYGRYDDYAYGR